LEGNYALIMGCKDSERTGAMLTLNVSGERCLAVFESAGTADEFALLGGLGPDWEVVDDPDGAFLELLALVESRGVKSVVVNPPAALKGSSAAVSPIPIERFMEG
jgi:hypothetical protein